MTKTKKKSNGNSFLGTLAALIILCVVLTIVSDKFLTYNNLMSVLKQTTFTALLSTGMLLCLITAGIDLSVGANATFCACICGMLVKGGMTNSLVLIVIAIVAGTLIGLDKNYALEQICGSEITVEYDKLIDRQLERAAITSISGFAKLFGEASKVLTV